MIPDLLMAAGYTAPTLAAMGTAEYYRRKAKPLRPKGKPQPAESLSAAIRAGYEAVDRMAKDIHHLYHPVGCKCAFCEIRSDDVDTPAPTGDLCANPCFGCSILTCKKHPDHRPAKEFTQTSLGIPIPKPPKGMSTIHFYINGKWDTRSLNAGFDTLTVNGSPMTVRCCQCGKVTDDMWIEATPENKMWCQDHWRWGKTLPDDTAYNPEYVRALQQKLDGYRKENIELRRNQTQAKVVSKTVERKTAFQEKIDQAAKIADREKEPLVLDFEYEGRPFQVSIGPQRPPDHVIEAFGEREPVQTRWDDRQLGTFFQKCSECGEKAFKIVGDGDYLCRDCYEACMEVLSEVRPGRREIKGQKING